MASDLPVVTVAMPIYNAGGYLRAAVNSIRLQTLQDWELLIIDDGSTDNAIACLAGLDDKRVRVIRDGFNRGLAARLNEAIDMARGEFFARMDQDDISYPERLEKQVARLRADAALDLVATRAIRIDESSEAIDLFPAPESDSEIAARPWQGFHMPHPSWTGRVQWFRDHRYATPGPYFCEDQELLLRSYPASRFAIVDEVLFAYRVRRRFNPHKQFRTRLAVWRVQQAQFAKRRQWLNLLLATLMLVARVAVDAATQLGWKIGGSDVRRESRLDPALQTQWLHVRAATMKAPAT
ncbi:glycosyltransferase family 2 protein [Variovorax sp. VNK109]|uniref:glycosyltransferase family 2 protein n=1 Tax=Variovorax sp. VNK109 TaxID=3400919 RepID=UPI003C0564EF